MSAARERGRRWSTGLMLLLFAAVALAPIGMPFFRSESAAWRAVALYRAAARGPVDARRQLDELADRRPQQPGVQRLAVAAHLDAGQPAAAEARCATLFAAPAGAPGDPRASQPAWLPIAHLRLEALWQLGEFERAAAWCETLYPPGDRGRPLQPSDLNVLAYARALAGRGLESARSQIESASQYPALEWMQRGVPRMDLASYAALGAALIASGDEECRASLTLLEREIDHIAAETPETETFDFLDFHWPGVSDLGSIDRFRASPEAEPWLRAVRAWMLERLGEPAASLAQRQALRKQGRDADEILRRIPRNAEIILALAPTIAFLDTRGYVDYRRGEIEPALRDLDAAVWAADVAWRHLHEFPAHNTRWFVDEQTYPRQEAAARRQLATLLHHRLLARQAAGDAPGAQQDRARRNVLGFTDDQATY